MKDRKPIVWVGSSKKDLLKLSEEVQSMLGYSLNLAQQGLKDVDSKPLKGFGGASVLEIIKADPGGTYRAIYTVKFVEAIFVLHVFQKKSKSGIATPKIELDMISNRIKDALNIHKEIYVKSQKNR